MDTIHRGHGHENSLTNSSHSARNVIPSSLNPGDKVVSSTVHPQPEQRKASNRSVHIKGLSSREEIDHVIQYLGRFGIVKSVRIPKNAPDGTFQGFFFLDMNMREGFLARCQTALHAGKFRGQALRIGIAKAHYLSRLRREKKSAARSLRRARSRRRARLLARNDKQHRESNIDIGEDLSSLSDNQLALLPNWSAGRYGRAVPTMMIKTPRGKFVKIEAKKVTPRLKVFREESENKSNPRHETPKAKRIQSTPVQIHNSGKHLSSSQKIDIQASQLCSFNDCDDSNGGSHHHRESERFGTIEDGVTITQQREDSLDLLENNWRHTSPMDDQNAYSIDEAQLQKETEQHLDILSRVLRKQHDTASTLAHKEDASSLVQSQTTGKRDYGDNIAKKHCSQRVDYGSLGADVDKQLTNYKATMNKEYVGIRRFDPLADNNEILSLTPTTTPPSAAPSLSSSSSSSSLSPLSSDICHIEAEATEINCRGEAINSAKPQVLSENIKKKRVSFAEDESEDIPSSRVSHEATETVSAESEASSDRFVVIENAVEKLKPASGDWRDTSTMTTFSFGFSFGGHHDQVTNSTDTPQREPASDYASTIRNRRWDDSPKLPSDQIEHSNEAASVDTLHSKGNDPKKDLLVKPIVAAVRSTGPTIRNVLAPARSTNNSGDVSIAKAEMSFFFPAEESLDYMK